MQHLEGFGLRVEVTTRSVSQSTSVGSSSARKAQMPQYAECALDAGRLDRPVQSPRRTRLAAPDLLGEVRDDRVWNVLAALGKASVTLKRLEQDGER